MGKINSRAKGASGELQVIEELKKLLPSEMTSSLARNLEQTRDGGHDILGLGNWALEVKRYAEIKPADMERFWEQTLTQARKDAKRPALVFRQDRREWRAVVTMGFGDEYEWTSEISMKLFAHLIKENWNV